MSKTINRGYNQIKSDILKCFQTKENWYRKELISECLKSFNLSESELKDNNSSEETYRAFAISTRDSKLNFLFPVSI